jgi:hypothetical protein
MKIIKTQTKKKLEEKKLKRRLFWWGIEYVLLSTDLKSEN